MRALTTPAASNSAGTTGRSRTVRILVTPLARNAIAMRASRMRERERDLAGNHLARLVSRGARARGGSRSARLGPASRCMVLGDNRPRLYGAMLAAMSARRLSRAGISRDAARRDLAFRARRPLVRARRRSGAGRQAARTARRSGQPTHIVYDDRRGLAYLSPAGLISLDAAATRGRARSTARPALRAAWSGGRGRTDGAVLLHSSGTTGAPKGVPLATATSLAGVDQCV